MYILDPLARKQGGALLFENKLTGEKSEIPTFTCAHCQRVVAMRPDRKRLRHTCRKCMANVCDYCTRECNPAMRDVKRAQANYLWQPWPLRHFGEPVDRIWAADGTSCLVLRKDNGNTERAIEKTMRVPEPKESNV